MLLLQGQDLLAVVSHRLCSPFVVLSVCFLVCFVFVFFFWRTFLYILYDTSLYRLFEDFDSSCQFGSFPKEIHPKMILFLFLGG